jgi:hypothetical protein
MVRTAIEPPDVVVVTVTGMLTMGDQVRVIEAVRELIRTNGMARVVLRLDGLAGIVPVDAATDPAALWLHDDEPVRKIAIVGEDRWRHQLLTLMAQPVRGIPIDYFETETAARAWLGSSGPSSPRSRAVTPD